MEKEFIKCEVNFKFNDGDVIHGERKVVRTANVGDYVERKIAEYRQRYGEELSKAMVLLFTWKYVPHKQYKFIGVCKDKKVKQYEVRI
jgi:hypothetical protein